MDNVIDILTERGLVDNVTDPEIHRILSEPVTVYAGFDPTSSSLQAGNLVAIMALAHFQRCGHRVIALVGGATGLIGDPSGKTSERALLDREQVERNVVGIRENLSRFLDFGHPTAPARIVNNFDWLGSYSLIDFLREVGKHFRVGTMLGKESVRTRLDSDAGMSFTEFSYQLLQACDFLHLFDTAGCLVQVGGSDQWGNITAGIDLIHKLRGARAFGATLPLVCDSAGQKFGKSAGNAIYLDRERTPVYEFYQFFVRAADADAVRFLKVFTFLSLGEIAELERQIASAPENRAAQRRLAEEATRLVHGEDGLGIARQATEVLFGGSLDGMRAADLLRVFADVPSADLPRARVVDAAAVDVAAAVGFCQSKGQARRLVESGGFYVNNRRLAGIDGRIGAADVIDGSVVVLRSGRKNFFLLRVA